MSFDSKDEVAPAATAEATAPATAEATAPEDEASLRARAEQFAQTLRREDVEGLKDIQNHMISMGLPATRALLRQFVEHSTAAGSPEQTRALKAVADLSPVTEVGCMRVDFHDRIANCGNTAYITLEECPRDHDLGAPLEFLRLAVEAGSADDKRAFDGRELRQLADGFFNLCRELPRGYEDQRAHAQAALMWILVPVIEEL